MSLTRNLRRENNRRKAEQWPTIRQNELERKKLTRALVHKIHAHFDGSLIWWWDEPQYDLDRKLSNPAFDKKPLLIAYVASSSDIREILKFCKDASLPMVLRSGGHNEAGYSAINDGVILDTSRLAGAYIDPRTRRLHVGPGTNFQQFWEKLDQYGLAATGGACPSVCVGGYMQGGGFGFTARMFGMSCDNVVEVEVMLADGAIVLANDSTNGDLFYAVRGGTGNNFGVLLSATYQAHPLPEATGFWISWDLITPTGDGAQNAAIGLDLLQREYCGSNPDTRLGFQTIFAYQGPADSPDMQGSLPYVMLRVMFNGTEAEGRTALRKILASPGTVLERVQRGRIKDLNDALIDSPRPVPQFPPKVSILPEGKQSRFLSRPLGVDNWRRVVDFFLTTETRLNVFTIIDFEGAGGAVNSLPIGTNAYIHRDGDGDIFLDVFWRDDEEQSKAIAYLKDWVALIEPLSNGRVYQNYPNADLDRWWERYWGDYWGVLRQIKSKYDPGNVFNFPQGIGSIPQQAVLPVVENPVAGWLTEPITILNKA